MEFKKTQALYEELKDKLQFNNIKENKNGRFNGIYNNNSSDSGEPEITTYLRGVVLQKKGVVSGQAETVDNGVGRFSIVPAE